MNIHTSLEKKIYLGLIKIFRSDAISNYSVLKTRRIKNILEHLVYSFQNKLA